MSNLPLADAPQPGPIELPDDPAVAELVDHGRDRFLEVVAAHPDSSLVWAILAEGALAVGDLNSDVAAYAFARTGYHRGLDALRRAGWRGGGPVPWEHEPNQGFLRALWALAGAARRIGEEAEHERCVALLRESSEAGYEHLSQTRPLAE
ncbi:MAG: DUF3151 domain-containing protein [Micropruina sp.]|nr:MAG: DUF3151 domain-containing protein [Micropruina sp.]